MQRDEKKKLISTSLLDHHEPFFPNVSHGSRFLQSNDFIYAYIMEKIVTLKKRS